MTQEYYTTGRKKFQHIKFEQRVKLEVLLEMRPKIPKKEIAKTLGISRSTLYDELGRGTVEQMDTNLKVYRKYFADVGQRVYDEHRKNSRNTLKLAKAEEFIEYAEEKILKEKLSPDAVTGYAKKYSLFGTGIVCTKTLYNYIDQGLLKVKNIDLPLRVRLKTKIRRDRKKRRILGDSIENRPEFVDSRSEPGHWEIDTIVGTVDSSPVLLTLDERVTRQRIIIKIESKTSEAVNKAVKEITGKYGKKAKKIFKSITSDNGSEFANLQEAFPFAHIYYAHPYSSWERGTNEKHNSLVRRFFPKGKSFLNVSAAAVSRVQDWINHLPRKIFNYSSSFDLFNDFVNNL